MVVYLTNKINSPVTDPAANPNNFNGNWYTASTLGFVGQMLYQGIEERTAVSGAALSALISDMANSKFKLVAAETDLTADHPIVRSAYALTDVLFDRAQESGSAEDWQYAENALAQLDETRDAEQIARLSEILAKSGKAE